jgi:hypothetical protein
MFSSSRSVKRRDHVSTGTVTPATTTPPTSTATSSRAPIRLRRVTQSTTPATATAVVASPPRDPLSATPLIAIGRYATAATFAAPRERIESHAAMGIASARYSAMSFGSKCAGAYRPHVMNCSAK